MLALIILSAAFYLLWMTPELLIKMNKAFGISAWLLHAIVNYYSLINDTGWNLNIINSILLVSWLSVLVVIVFKINSQWVKIPLVVFVLMSFILLDNAHSFNKANLKEFSWQLDLHISLSMLAYALLSVASLYALSLWVHIKRIKNSDFQSGGGLISLIEEEKKLVQLISLGWLILSTSLISGVIFVENFVQQHLGHKVVFSLLAWFIYGLLILGRISKGWRGEKLISLTIMGMALLAMGYLGSKIVLLWIL